MNIFDPECFDQAVSILQSENHTCTTCGLELTRFYNDGVDESGKRPVLRVSGHCGQPGHNMYPFTFTTDDFRG